MIYFFLSALLLSLSATAQNVPNYLKDGTITVTLKSGKTYNFSSNEYMVVKRSAPKLKAELADSKKDSQQSDKQEQSQPKRLKHIVSGEVLRSNGGLETSTSANQVDVRNRKQMGVGIQYQYNFHKDLFLGGRVDTNGGAGMSLGVGF